METVSLQFPSHPRLLRIVRSVICTAAETVGFSTRQIDEICLAVDEACSNIMRHCYGGDCDQPIELDCCLESDYLLVKIRDFGPPFVPEDVPDRDLEDVRPGGLGLHLIKRLMDDVTYRALGASGTELVLVKYVNAKGEVVDER